MKKKIKFDKIRKSIGLMGDRVDVPIIQGKTDEYFQVTADRFINVSVDGKLVGKMFRQCGTDCWEWDRKLYLACCGRGNLSELARDLKLTSAKRVVRTLLEINYENGG